MKKLITCFVFFLFSFCAWSADLQKAEKLFADGDFATALPLYEQAISSASGSTLWQAQLRSAACRYHSGEFLNAAKAMLSYPLPTSDDWKARFLLYRIQMARQASNAYHATLQEREIDSESARQDPEQWTRRQWQAQIEQDYQTLWKMKNELSRLPTAGETLILNTKETDLERIPTLFDFVVQNWLDDLNDTSVTPQPRAYLNGYASVHATAKEKIEKRAQILQTAYSLGGKNRQNAQLFWQTDYILLPFEWEDSFTFSNREKAVQAAVETLKTLGRYRQNNSVLNKLKNYTSQKEDYGRSYALYRAAQLAYENDLRQEALSICQFATTLSRSYYTDRCTQLARQITEPVFSINKLAPALNPQDTRVAITVRNSDHLYARLYPVTKSELQQLPTPHYYENQPLRYFTQLTNPGVQMILNEYKNYTPLSQDITYKKPYFDEKISLPLPPMDIGFYVLLVSTDPSFDPQKEAVRGVILNCTDLALFVTSAIEDNPDKYTRTLQSAARTFTPNIFRFYTVNLKTGKMAPRSQVELFKEGNNKGTLGFLTDAQGKAALSRSINPENSNNWYHFFAQAQKDGSTALIPSEIFFHFSRPEPVQLFVQTDRAIYRPGQKVSVSVQAFQNVVRGKEVLPHTKVKLQVRNANYDTFFTTTLTTNAMGTAQTQLTLPEEVRLGNFHVEANAEINFASYSGGHSFKVEEYKRPDYEISLNKADKPLAYNKTATLTGHAQYYSGAPLGDAQVNYTVTREEYVPPFYWWYRFPSGARQEIARGLVRTDKQGNFRISFTPKPTRKDEAFALYRVQAEVLDPSGRAIETSSSYKVSVQPSLFKATFAQGFYDAGKPLNHFMELDLTNADGQSVTGKISVQVSRLQPSQNPASEEEPSWKGQIPAWEKWYKDAPSAGTVFTKEISFNKPGAQTLSLPSLTEGVYRLTLKNTQATPQNLLFVVVKDGKTLSLPDITLAQHDTYYPGQTARVLIGDARLQGTTLLEFYTQGDFLLDKTQLPGGGVRVIERVVQPTDRGGIALRWFGASNYQFHQGTTMVEVPFNNKELAVSIDAPQTLLPGQKVTWNITAKNSAQTPVNGQASLTVYDQSLDYYAKKGNPFTLTQLFPQTAQPGSSFLSQLNNPVVTYFTKRTNDHWTNLLPLPTLNLSMNYRLYKGIRSLGAAPKMMAMATNSFASMDMAYDASDDDDGDLDAMEESADMKETVGAALPQAAQAAKTAAGSTEVSPRTNFAETAYFNALLPVTNGKGTAQFTLPDSLTTWNILGYVLTQQGALGAFEATSVARKDFMVRTVLPRFYREGDKGIVQAAVTNLTRKTITVPVTLSVRYNNAPALKDFGITVPTKALTVPPQETAFASWNITAPYAPGVYQMTASAKSFQASDGEQKDFLVLPGTTRLLATANKALKNGTNTLTVTELAGNTSARAEIAQLNVHPSLALSVLNSMPHLLLTPHRDLVSSLNRYVPLAVVHQFYTTYPQLKEAVKKLPKRSGLSSPWNEKDPLRLTLLEQTPWTYQARGRQAHNADIINLFDDKTVSSYLQKEMEKIKKFQKSSGAFSWFEGGPDDSYLTLYALEAFAQALHYKATIPTQQAQRAFSYIIPKIEKALKEDKEGSEQTVSFALYAAYVLSSFPQEWAQVSKAKPYLKKWADYADSQSRFMTPLGQIYAAAVYHRLGDDIKANAYLDKVLARMKTNELTGAYFAPEAQSWVWYRDTLTTQTVTLRTLLELRPQSEKIDQMVQWLLFNRQVNQWNHSKGVAQAVFTLLDVMQTKGALSTASTYKLDWADLHTNVRFEPFDWTADLQWTRQGKEITPADFTATVTKQSKMTDFASLSVVYRAATANASPKGVINVERNYFVRYTQDGVQKLRPVSGPDKVAVGDEVEVQLTLTSDSEFEYVLLSDPKPAGFESADLLSQWTWDPVSMYREIRDAQTQFFINWLPAGKITLRYVLRPTVPGTMNVLPAQAQSMYAPEYGAHTASRTMQVEP